MLCTQHHLQANILIDRDGKALLVDFGLSAIKVAFEGISYYESTVGGALRWRAPELLAVSEDHVLPNLNTACDVYSYGSVMLQVCTCGGIYIQSSCFPSDLDWQSSISLSFGKSRILCSLQGDQSAAPPGASDN